LGDTGLFGVITLFTVMGTNSAVVTRGLDVNRE
jgi:hypothetical protein